jgi:hypothetical protein
MAKADKQEPAKRRGWVASVASDAGHNATIAFTRAGFSDPTLVLRWAEIAGAEVARLARPIKFTAGSHGGVLTLKAEPAAALFLQHETRNLCGRINSYLGREAVSRIKFIQGPLLSTAQPRPAARSGTVPISDPALKFQGAEGIRAALLSLAAKRVRTPD